MPSIKTSKTSNKIADISAAPVSEQTIADSKPAKRTKSPSATKAASSKPAQASHRHSKLAVPATPVVEEVISEVVVAAAPSVADEEIARLAYSFWEERNYAHGNAEEDWFRAVQTLSATSAG